jgi:hypothetical protein
MKTTFHIAADMPSPKRDAGLRACEWRVALPHAFGLRNYFGSNSID